MRKLIILSAIIALTAVSQHALTSRYDRAMMERAYAERDGYRAKANAYDDLMRTAEQIMPAEVVVMR